MGVAYKLGRLRASNVEFEVGVLLPVAEEKRKLEKKPVEGIAHKSQSLRAGVSVEATLLGLAGANELLPVLEAVGIGFLCK